MTSSPYNPKKARASLTCNISNFFEPNETSTFDHSEDFSSTHDFHLEEAQSNSTSFNQGKDLPSHLKDKLTTNTMDQIYLFDVNGQRIELQKRPSRSIDVGLCPILSGKQPIFVGELPRPFYYSKCFQTFDTHFTEDLAILNLYDTVKIVKSYDGEALITRLMSSESFMSSIALGRDRLNGYFVTSDLSSHISVYEIEGKKCLRKYNVLRPSKAFASSIKQENTQLYCGFTNGSIRVFDVRMRSNVHYFADTPISTQNIDALSFNPITSLAVKENRYLLSTSSNKLCLWDLRKNGLANKIEGNFGEGVLKTAFYPNESQQQALALRYGDNDLKIVDLFGSGDVETLMSAENPIKDFDCSQRSNELFLLFDKREKEHLDKRLEACLLAEDSQKSLVKTEVKIYSIGDDEIREGDRIEMGRDFESLKISQNGTKLWMFGKFILLNFRPILDLRFFHLMFFVRNFPTFFKRFFFSYFRRLRLFFLV